MKTRTNYVSNSSSSSFVVIPDDVARQSYGISPSLLKSHVDSVKSVFMNHTSSYDYENGEWNGFLDGETKFGWQTCNYHDMESKWNWLVLSAHYGGSEFDSVRTIEFCLLLDGYLKDIGLNATIDWDAVEKCVDNLDAYIDHQSIDAAQTFAEVNSIGITEWLSNSSCYIKNGNDNG